MKKRRYARVGVEKGFGPRHAFNAQEGSEAVPSELPTPPQEPYDPRRHSFFENLTPGILKAFGEAGSQLAGMSKEDAAKLAVSMLVGGEAEPLGGPGAVPTETWQNWKTVTKLGPSGREIRVDPAGNHYEPIGSQIIRDESSGIPGESTQHVIARPVEAPGERKYYVDRDGIVKPVEAPGTQSTHEPDISKLTPQQQKEWLDASPTHYWSEAAGKMLPYEKGQPPDPGWTGKIPHPDELKSWDEMTPQEQAKFMGQVDESASNLPIEETLPPPKAQDALDELKDFLTKNPPPEGPQPPPQEPPDPADWWKQGLRKGKTKVGVAKGFGPRHAENAQEGMEPALTRAPVNTDTVPAMLTPKEAVLNRNAAELAGRGNIEALNEDGNALASKGVDLAARGQASVPSTPVAAVSRPVGSSDVMKYLRSAALAQVARAQVPRMAMQKGSGEVKMKQKQAKSKNAMYNSIGGGVPKSAAAPPPQSGSPYVQGFLKQLGKAAPPRQPQGFQGGGDVPQRGWGGLDTAAGAAPQPMWWQHKRNQAILNAGPSLDWQHRRNAAINAGFDQPRMPPGYTGAPLGAKPPGYSGGPDPVAGIGQGVTPYAPPESGNPAPYSPPGGAPNSMPPLGGGDLGGGAILGKPGGPGGLPPESGNPTPYVPPGVGSDPQYGVNPAFPGRGPGGVYPGGGNTSGSGGTGSNPNLSGNYGDPGGSYSGGPISLPGIPQPQGMGQATNWMKSNSFYPPQGGYGFAGGTSEVNPQGIGAPAPGANFPVVQLTAPDIMRFLQGAGAQHGLTQGQISGLAKAFQSFGQGGGGMNEMGGYGDAPPIGAQGGISDIGYPPAVAPDAVYHGDKGSNWIGQYDPNYMIPRYARGTSSVPFR